jgi:hypothetical protein
MSKLSSEEFVFTGLAALLILYVYKKWLSTAYRKLPTMVNFERDPPTPVEDDKAEFVAPSFEQESNNKQESGNAIVFRKEKIIKI